MFFLTVVIFLMSHIQQAFVFGVADLGTESHRPPDLLSHHDGHDDFELLS